MIPLRKPLATVEPTRWARLESKDERVTIRLTTTQRTVLAAAAVARGDELSRYLRECSLIGHSVLQSQAALKVTAG